MCPRFGRVLYVFELLAKNQNSQLIGLNVLKWIALRIHEPDSLAKQTASFLAPMAASRGGSRPGTRQIALTQLQKH